jgi:hypothetical protein
MANETTITTLTEIVNAEMIIPRIMDYAIDAMVATSLCRMEDLSGAHSKVASFPIFEKDTAVAVAEAASLSNNDFTTADTQVTAGQVGILREITKMAAMTNVLGPVGIGDAIARDGGMLCAEVAENDTVALFPSITASVGATGVDLSVANMIEAIGKFRTAKSRGVPVFVLDDQQMVDLSTAVAAATGTVWASGNGQSILNSSTTGIAGQFLGSEVRWTGLTDTANAGADVVGALLNTGVPEATIGFVWLWAPTLDTDKDIAKVSTKYAITTAYGVGLINDGSGVKLVTDA